jgi:hypothetical protein
MFATLALSKPHRLASAWLLGLLALGLGTLLPADAHSYGQGYGYNGGGYHHGYGRVVTPTCPPPAYGAYGGAGYGYRRPVAGPGVWVQQPRPIVIVQPRVVQRGTYYTTPRGFATSSYGRPGGFSSSSVTLRRIQRP